MYIKIKSGSKTSHSSYVGPDRSLSIDTDNQILRLHDGDVYGGTSAAGIPDLPPNDDLIYLLGKDRWVPTELNESFSGLKGEWEQLAPHPLAGRQQHAAVAIDGKMHVFGGYTGSSRLNDLWEYDPQSDTWLQLTSGATGRNSHTAVAIDGKMYVYGGFDGSVRFNDLWVYDPQTDEWLQLTSGATARNGHTAVAMSGKMYVFGGYDGSVRFNDLWVCS